MMIVGDLNGMSDDKGARYKNVPVLALRRQAGLRIGFLLLYDERFAR